MTIDLSKLKAGDTVEFRCGGKAIVSDVHSDGLFHLIFDNNERLSYFNDGDYCGNSVSLFDIIAIHPAKVKRSGEIWYVVYDVANELRVDTMGSLEAVKNTCKDFKNFKPLAITNKTTWTEGDGLELLEGVE